jgi:hypothetical protein
VQNSGANTPIPSSESIDNLTKLDEITSPDDTIVNDVFSPHSAATSTSTSAFINDTFTSQSTTTSVLASTSGYCPPVEKFFTPPNNSADLLPIPQEMQIYLFGVLSSRYLKEVPNIPINKILLHFFLLLFINLMNSKRLLKLVVAFEQISHNSLAKALQMIQSCCYCNESFSANIIHQILLNINTLSSNDTKQALYLLNSIIVRV